MAGVNPTDPLAGMAAKLAELVGVRMNRFLFLPQEYQGDGLTAEWVARIGRNTHSGGQPGANELTYSRGGILGTLGIVFGGLHRPIHRIARVDVKCDEIARNRF